MATGKPLQIVLDEALYHAFPALVDGLVAQGHTVKAINTHGYDAVLGPKFGNLTVEDIKANPKLLDVALARTKDMKYPKVAKPSKKKVNDGVEDPQEIAKLAEAGGVEEITEVPPAPRKRKPRAKNAANKGAGGKGAEPAVDPTPNPETDPTSGGK